MARLPLVKCLYCGQSFQRADTEFIQVGRRYAHKDCANYIKEIHTFMKHILGETYSQTKIDSQIKNFISQNGLSVEAIYKTLIYWYEIKKSSSAQANGGIGIVPYIYAEYLQYMKDQFENSQINKGKNISEYVGDKPTEIIGRATPIRKPRHIKFYELS
jgi:hypothetical protein